MSGHNLNQNQMQSEILYEKFFDLAGDQMSNFLKNHESWFDQLDTEKKISCVKMMIRHDQEALVKGLIEEKKVPLRFPDKEGSNKCLLSYVLSYQHKSLIDFFISQWLKEPEGFSQCVKIITRETHDFGFGFLPNFLKDDQWAGLVSGMLAQIFKDGTCSTQQLNEVQKVKAYSLNKLKDFPENFFIKHLMQQLSELEAVWLLNKGGVGKIDKQNETKESQAVDIKKMMGL